MAPQPPGNMFCRKCDYPLGSETVSDTVSCFGYRFLLANWLDRMIRRDHWLEFSHDRAFVPALRRLDPLLPDLYGEEQGRQDMKELTFLFQDLAILDPKSDAYQRKVAETKVHIETIVNRKKPGRSGH